MINKLLHNPQQLIWVGIALIILGSLILVVVACFY